MQFMKAKKIVQRQQNEVGALRQQPRSENALGVFLGAIPAKTGQPSISRPPTASPALCNQEFAATRAATVRFVWVPIDSHVNLRAVCTLLGW